MEKNQCPFRKVYVHTKATPVGNGVVAEYMEKFLDCTKDKCMAYENGKCNLCQKQGRTIQNFSFLPPEEEGWWKELTCQIKN